MFSKLLPCISTSQAVLNRNHPWNTMSLCCSIKGFHKWGFSAFVLAHGRGTHCHKAAFLHVTSTSLCWGPWRWCWNLLICLMCPRSLDLGFKETPRPMLGNVTGNPSRQWQMGGEGWWFVTKTHFSVKGWFLLCILLIVTSLFFYCISFNSIIPQFLYIIFFYKGVDSHQVSRLSENNKFWISLPFLNQPAIKPENPQMCCCIVSDSKEDHMPVLPLFLDWQVYLDSGLCAVRIYTILKARICSRKTSVCCYLLAPSLGWFDRLMSLGLRRHKLPHTPADLTYKPWFNFWGP